MPNIDKPIRLGRGFTRLYVTICLTEKAWNKALERHSMKPEFPGELHASATHFPPEDGHAPFTLITIQKKWRKSPEDAFPLLAHEFIHCKQRCEEMMQTTFDHETEAYYVQHLTEQAWLKIKRFSKK